MTSQPPGRTIGDVVASMRERLELMPSGQQARRDFLSTYVRTTEAVAAAAEAGTFEDPAWVERWDVAFADLYLTALDADLAGSPGVSRPWRLAFAVPQDLPALRNVLVGVNAHINYDQPQSLLAVISDEAFADPVLLARRRRDHGRIDGILSARVSAEDSHLATRTARSALDRVLTPVNRLAARSLLREAREKVWHNTTELHRARLEGPMAYAARLAELELLSAARVADLLASGQVLLRLAVGGFGVSLPPPA